MSLMDGAVLTTPLEVEVEPTVSTSFQVNGSPSFSPRFVIGSGGADPALEARVAALETETSQLELDKQDDLNIIVVPDTITLLSNLQDLVNLDIGIELPEDGHTNNYKVYFTAATFSILEWGANRHVRILSISRSGSSYTITSSRIYTENGQTGYVESIGYDLNTAFINYTTVSKNNRLPYASIYGNAAEEGRVLFVNAGGAVDTAGLATINGQAVLGGGEINTKELPTTLGTTGQVLTVNSNADGVEWTSVPNELPSIAGNAGKVLTVNANATSVEWVQDTSSDSWRNIQINGTEQFGTGTDTGAINFTGSGSVSVSANSGTVTISGTDTVTSIDGQTGAITTDSSLSTNASTKVLGLTGQLPYLTTEPTQPNTGNFLQIVRLTATPTNPQTGYLYLVVPTTTN